ncbi:MAG: excinuclease ABC subunit UvrC [Leptospiraceae bacterium]|nr:excinuclease ABC subunit UvrC [Leptospiraceae bacterium]MDW8305963.1 excinuclease ABC subunit UvrC [Leptospiraceae bacterium]
MAREELFAINPALEEIAEKIAHIPTTPGCYLWIRREGDEKKVLYIGKSVNLRSRIRHYFNTDDYKTRFLMQRVQDIEWVSTHNELEALLLENTLIKKHRPPYNVQLKDDKRYPYLCLTMGEMYPRLILTRRKFGQDHVYFGPFSDVQAARNTLQLIHKIFPIRKRPLKLPLKKPGRPCLNFHLKRCWAPCTGQVDVNEYRQMVLEIKDFLEGKSQQVEENIRLKMEYHANRLEFEKAARYRDILRDLEKLRESQQVESASEENDFDILGMVVYNQEELVHALDIEEKDLPHQGEGNYVFAQLTLLRVRRGKLIFRQNFAFSEQNWPSMQDEATVEFISSFFRDYYLTFRDIPGEIYFPHKIPDRLSWQKLLSEKRGTPVVIYDDPKHIGEKQHLVDMAITNAKLSLKERLLNEKLRSRKLGMLQLQKLLGLKELPRLIECYDISNIQGKHAVASQVVLKEAMPYKSLYRRYKIRTIEGPNDPAMLAEVIGRRLEHIKKGESKIPDLIVLDGGQGQLNVCVQKMKEKGFSIPMIALAKKREEIYLPDGRVLQPDPLSPGMLILRQARDEAHRFGLAYHRKVRLMQNLRSLFRDIPGIGENREKKILVFLRKISLSDYTVPSLAEAIRKEASLSEKLAEQVAQQVFKLADGE